MTESIDHTPEIDFVLSHFKSVRKSTNGWTACCPAHQDRHPSLSIGVGKDGRILLKCHAGCTFESIVQAENLSRSDLFPASAFDPSRLPHQGLTLLDLAADKLIPWQLLVNMGITDDPKGGVRIPYYLEDGTPAPRYRIRTALKAKEGSRWNSGPGIVVPYGLEDLEEARTADFLVVVEGESDRWTLKLHHFPVLGLPGAEMTRTLKPEYLTGIERLYLFRESDAAGAKFVADIQKLLQQWNWSGMGCIVSLPDAKDPNDLHKRDPKGFKAAFQEALDHAEQVLPAAGDASTPPLSSSKPPSPTGLVTLQTLLEKPFFATRWTVTDLLPEGLSLLAGKPKQGKSWLALQLAFDVATGSKVFHTYPTTQGDVLFLALEDTESRIQERAKRLLTSMDTPSGDMTFATDWPRLDLGGIAQLETFLHTHPHHRLLVIDTWAKLAPPMTGTSQSQYMGDYSALAQLKRLADQFYLSILVVHHLRKTSAVDVLDEITGSSGLVGVADTVLVLKRERGQQEASLFVTGRDIVERSSSLTFDATTVRWKLAPPTDVPAEDVVHTPPISSPSAQSLTSSVRPSQSSSSTSHVPMNRCAHHPAATRVLFDPSGQAWCERTDCWDCYRLMKIGEALDYPALTGGDKEARVGQGRDAWATFMRTHGAFAIGTATRIALTICQEQGIDEPDLSNDLQHLVTLPPSTRHPQPGAMTRPGNNDGKKGTPYDHTT